MAEFLTTALSVIGSLAMSDIGKVIIGAIGALGIAWVNTRLGIWRDERAEERRRKGAVVYSVVLIEATLRRYVRDCMDVMTDNGEGVVVSGNEYEDWKSSVPEPTLVYPDKIDWTLIHPDIIFNAIAIPVIEMRRKADVREAYDFADPPNRDGYIEARQMTWAQQAMFSARVQADFHIHHPGAYTSDQRDVIETISAKMNELEAAKLELERDNAGWIAAMESSNAEAEVRRNSEDKGHGSPGI